MGHGGSLDGGLPWPLAARTTVSSAFHPLPSLREFVFIEVFYRRFGKWFADRRHPFFPLFIADQRDLFEVGVVRPVKFDIIPERFGIPTMEIMEIGEQPDFAMFLDGRFEQWHELFVIIVMKFTGQFEAEDVTA